MVSRLLISVPQTGWMSWTTSRDGGKYRFPGNRLGDLDSVNMGSAVCTAIIRAGIFHWPLQICDQTREGWRRQTITGNKRARAFHEKVLVRMRRSSSPRTAPCPVRSTTHGLGSGHPTLHWCSREALTHGHSRAHNHASLPRLPNSGNDQSVYQG